MALTYMRLWKIKAGKSSSPKKLFPRDKTKNATGARAAENIAEAFRMTASAALYAAAPRWPPTHIAEEFHTRLGKIGLTYRPRGKSMDCTMVPRWADFDATWRDVNSRPAAVVVDHYEVAALDDLYGAAEKVVATVWKETHLWTLEEWMRERVFGLHRRMAPFDQQILRDELVEMGLGRPSPIPINYGLSDEVAEDQLCLGSFGLKELRAIWRTMRRYVSDDLWAEVTGNGIQQLDATWQSDVVY